MGAAGKGRAPRSRSVAPGRVVYTEGMDDTPQQPTKARFLGARLGEAHPCADPKGWPEFEVTLEFYVESDDPEVIERERKQLFERVADPYVS